VKTSIVCPAVASRGLPSIDRRMEEAGDDLGQMASHQALCDADQKTRKRPGISTLKVLKLSKAEKQKGIFVLQPGKT